MPCARSTLLDLTRNDWTLIESKARRMSVGLGHEIIQEGARIDRLYILRRGSASVELDVTTGYSGEGERRFRREAERRSGAKVNSSRSEATLAW